MRKKFGVLRIIAWTLRVLGGLVLVVAFIAAIASLVAGFTSGFSPMGHFRTGQMMGYWSGFGMFVSGLFGGIFLYGAGEVVDLLLAIEENTRAMRELPETKPEPPVEQ